MKVIHTEKKIYLEWEIYKGNSQVHENFNRAKVWLYLISPIDRYLVNCTVSNGTIYASLPMDIIKHDWEEKTLSYPINGLSEGVYSVEAIWCKDWEHYLSHPYEGIEPGIYHHPHPEPYPWHGIHHPHDAHICHPSTQTHLIGNKIAHAEYEYLFSITEMYDEDNTGSNEPVTIHFASPAATYGYDGLSAYQIATMRGMFTGSECEFIYYLMHAIGKRGEDGLSAYELAVKFGFRGTIEEWLNSLKGKDGKDGKDGITPEIFAEAGPHINEVGTPTVTTRKEGNKVYFIFDYLKGECDCNKEIPIHWDPNGGHWDELTYSITWKTNGGKWSNGSTADKTTSVKEGVLPVAPETPTRNGYTFKGWNPSIVTTTGDAVYISTWEKNQTTPNEPDDSDEPVNPPIDEPDGPSDGDISFKQLSVGYLPYNGMSLAELKQNLENQNTNWMGDPTGGGVAVQDDDLGYYGFNSDGTNECYAVAWYDVSFWYHNCGCHITYVFVDGEIYSVRSTDTAELNVEDVPEEYWPEAPEFSWDIIAADTPPQIEISDGGILTTTRVNNNNTVGDVCRYTNSQGVEVWTHIQASINVYPPVTPNYFASVLQAPKS